MAEAATRIPVIIDEELGEIYRVTENVFKIGRARDGQYGENNIGLFPSEEQAQRITDKRGYREKITEVSREAHVTLTLEPDGWHIEPKEGKLVYINDNKTPLAGKARIESGTRILLGKNKYPLTFAEDAI